MNAPAAPAIDVEDLRLTLERAERAAWAHGRTCGLSNCTSCIALMDWSRKAFGALADIAGEDAALDVLAAV